MSASKIVGAVESYLITCVVKARVQPVNTFQQFEEGKKGDQDTFREATKYPRIVSGISKPRTLVTNAIVPYLDERNG